MPTQLSIRVVICCSLLALAFGSLACNDKSDPPVATINGKPITQAQWNAFLKLKRVKPGDAAQQKALLDEYLSRAALADVIEQEKVLDNEAMSAELEEFKKEMLISRYFERYLDDKVSDQAIQSYYDAHAADYEEKKIHVAHILFRTQPKMSEEERKAKLTAAMDASSQLKAGKDFAALAAAMSEDQVSAKTGGDLGLLREGSVDPAFSKKAFSLKVGEVSEPIETPFGYHVIKVLEAPQVVKQPLRAVQGDIRYQLRAAAKKAEMDRLIAKTKIEIDAKTHAPAEGDAKGESKLAESK